MGRPALKGPRSSFAGKDTSGGGSSPTQPIRRQANHAMEPCGRTAEACRTAAPDSDGNNDRDRLGIHFVDSKTFIALLRIGQAGRP